MRRSDLPALSMLTLVAARRSFRAASRELGISVSAVSHAIRGLEERLGVRLLSRTTRTVAPTEAGRQLLGQLEPALAAIEDALEATTTSQDILTGTLRFSVPRTAAELALLPLAIEFQHHHPQVTIEICVQDDFTDIVAAGFDAGVRLVESLQQDMIAVTLGPAQRTAIVGSPAYFQGRRAPAHPRELHDHVCVRHRLAGGSIYEWEFEKGPQVTVAAVSGGIILNDPRLIIDAVLAGAGLGYVFEAQVADDIRSGRLMRVLEDWCPHYPGFFLYYPNRQLMRPALRAFVDFIETS